jgi:hypothetical protein
MKIPDDLSSLRNAPFAEALTKLEELMTQSGRAFLIGAGCSYCAGLPLTVELTKRTLASGSLDASAKSILQALEKQFAGSSNAHIEDYLSELVDHLAIADRRLACNATSASIVLHGQTFTADQLREAVEQIKRAIAAIIDHQVSIETHWKFIKAVHRPIRPGKTSSQIPIDYLVLNYDTLIEDALALEKLPFSDGLDGGVTAWWNPSVFDRDGLAARVLKLHGSINWCEFPDDPLPRRVPSKLTLDIVKDRKVLIWPASTKYRETQRDPYAQLSNLARQVMRGKEDSQRVLVICGYSFGDSHINLEIDRALKESSGRLTLVVFTSDEKPLGQLKLWHENPSVREQVLIFARKGFFHSDKVSTTNDDLLWWKFENIARLLGGER